MMNEDTGRCNQELLSIFIDGEAGPEDSRQVERHLQSCPACQRYVQQQKELAQLLRQEVSLARQAVDFQRLEEQIFGKTAKRPAPGHPVRQWLLSWKLMLPVAATAALILLFSTSLFDPPAPPGPSAIIKSFTGRVSSVMILETPQSHRTVIWYSEEAMEGNGTESKKL
jgi:anti-sigma factor RsiW